MTLHNACHQRIAEQKRRIDYLEAENLNLKNSLNGMAVKFAFIKGVTPTMSRILTVLEDGQVHPIEELARRCCANSCSTPNTISTMCYAFHAAQSDIRISSLVTGPLKGRYLEGASLARVRSIINGEAHD